MRALIAEDSLFVRKGLSALLGSAGFEILAEVDSAEELISLAHADPPDVIITDIKMPPDFGEEGLVAAEAIKSQHPEVGILVLSQYVEVGYARKLLSSPGVGYLLKDRIARVEEFIDAVRRVAAGEVVIDSALVDRLMQKRREHDRLEELSGREKELLRLMAEGRSNEGICRALFLSPKTVETHIRNIFNKLALAPSSEDHRRVLAVLDYLRG